MNKDVKEILDFWEKTSYGARSYVQLEPEILQIYAVQDGIKSEKIRALIQIIREYQDGKQPNEISLLNPIHDEYLKQF